MGSEETLASNQLDFTAGRVLPDGGKLMRHVASQSICRKVDFLS